MEEQPSQRDLESSKGGVPRTPAVWLATGFGAGLVAPAPGTVGGLWGILLAIAISHLPGWWIQIVGIGILCLVGIPLCTRAAKDLGAKDPGAIAFDEIASLPIVFLFFPPLTADTWLLVVVGFLLHRFFDILKPPPARQMERLPDGLGIMADDWIAGIYACAVLHGMASIGNGWIGF